MVSRSFGLGVRSAGIAVVSVILIGSMLNSASAISLHDMPVKSGVLLLGNGVGTIQCKNGNTYDNIEIFILVADNSDSSTRNPSGAGLSSEDNKRLAIEITDYNKEDGKSDFRINGIVLFDQLCNSSSSTTSLMEGQCSDEGTLSLETSNGSSGQFKSTIQCATGKT